MSIADAYVDLHVNGKHIAGEVKAIVRGAGPGADAEANRAGKRIGDKMGASMGKSLAGALLGKGAMFTSLGVAAGGGVPQILSLAGSLAEVAKVGALLPAVMGAGAASIATLVVGFKGFGGALKNMGDPKKFAAALKELSPNARAAAMAIKSVGPAWGKLQDLVQQNLFAGFAAQVRSLSGTYLPVLTRGMGALSTSFSKGFANIANAVKTINVIRGVKAVFSNTAKAMQPFLIGIGQVIEAFTQMAGVGSSFLPGLAGGFVGLATKFKVFIDQASKSGALKQFIQEGLTATRQLLGVLGSLSSIIINIVKAAQSAGGGGLAQLGVALAGIAAVVASPAFQTGLSAFFAGLMQGTAGVMTALPAVGALLASLGPVIGSLLGPIGSLIGTALGGLATALQSVIPYVIPIVQALIGGLQPAIAAVTAALPGLVAQIGPVAVSLAQGIGKALQFVVPLIGPFISAISSIAGFLGPLIPLILGGVVAFKAIGAAVSFLGPIIRGISVAWKILSFVFAASPIGVVVVGLIALVAGLIYAYRHSEKFRAIVQAAFAAVQVAVGAVVSWITGTVVPAFVAAWNWISNGAKAVWAAVSGAFTGIMTTVGGIITGVVSAIVGFVARLISIGVQIVTVLSYPWRLAIALILTAAYYLFQALAPIIMTGVNAVVGFFKAMWTRVTAIFNMLRTTATAIWSLVLGTIRRAVNGVVTYVLARFNALRSGVSAAFNAVRSVVSSVWNAISSAIGAAVSRIRALVSAGFNALRAVVSGPLNALRGIATAAFNRVASAIRGAVSAIKIAVSSVVKSITTPVKDIVGEMASIGGNIVGGLVRGIRSGADAVAGAVRNIIDKIPGPIRKAMGIKSPSRVMMEIGRYIGTGLSKGIKGTTSQVQSTVETLAKKITTAFQDKLDTKKNPKAGLNAAAVFLAHTKHLNVALVDVAKQREKVADRLKAAQGRLVDAVKVRNDFATSIADSLRQFGGIATIEDSSTATSGDLVKNLRNRLATIKKFTYDLAALRKMGLSKAAYAEILGAGAEQGGSIAAALRAGGKGAVGQVNYLNSQISKASGSLGTAAAKTMYQAGVSAAAGLVKGLESQSTALAKSAKNLANRLVKAVRKALGIHSPSRVMAAQGDYAVKGFVNSISAGQRAASRAGTLLANSVPTANGSGANGGTGPLPGTSLAGGAQGLGTVHVNVSVDDLAKMGKVADFVDLLSNARMNQRRQIGTVRA